MSIKIEIDDESALKDFLLDISCLDPLSEWTSKINLFDVLKITRTEIRHSNMLAWLLNPNENHGLGDSVLRGFIFYGVTSFSGFTDVFETLLMDCSNFSVFREWNSIDIVAVSREKRFVLCIENKIDSREHNDQLNRYRAKIEDVYPDFRKLFIYLSPEGDLASDPDNWCSMSYSDVLRIVESSSRRFDLSSDAKLLIENYIQTIRRIIMGDERLARICQEIYAKHQKALDLIYENRPDHAAMLAEIIREWAKEMTDKGEIEFVADKSVKSYTRFKTKTMSDIMPDADLAKSGWNTSNFYFYEIRNLDDGKDMFIQLALSSKNIPDDLRETCDKINKFFPSKQQKTNWQWRIPFSTKHSKFDEELSREKVFEELDKRLKDIKVFESKLVSLLESE